jgi:predicted nuclease with TOPRIM domain
LCNRREAEQQLSAVRAEAAASASEAPELLRQLAVERSQHEEQQAHLASELQGLRQQLMQLQQAAAKAEAAAKADGSAAAHAAKQLALQEKQHKAEVG